MLFLLTFTLAPQPALLALAKDAVDCVRVIGQRFTAPLRELLHAQRAYVDGLQKKYGKIIPWVFPTAEGEPLFCIETDDDGVQHKKATGYFRSCWRFAQRKSGILKGTHNLRVTAAVERDNAGLSIEDNMNAGGWRSADVIRRYLSKSRADKQAAARKIDEYRRRENTETVAKPSQRKP